jgi:hypothetical protein
MITKNTCHLAVDFLVAGGLSRRGYPVSILEIIEKECENLKKNIHSLWDDFFIETCADWVIPHIGYGDNSCY